MIASNDMLMSANTPTFRCRVISPANRSIEIGAATRQRVCRRGIRIAVITPKAAA